MMDDIQMMAMSFDYYQEVDLKTARELIVQAINEYLSAINNNKEIRPYLHEYPFTAKNVGIRIFIYNPDRSELSLEKIDCITSLNGMLKYYTRSNPRLAIYEETYEEALKETTLIIEGVAKDGAKANIEVISLEYSMFQLRDRAKLTFTVSEGKFDSSLEDFSLEVLI